MEYNASLRRYTLILLWLIPVLAIISILGFFPTYFHLAPHFTGMSWVVHFHILSVFTWFAMLITQALLEMRGRIELHRKLGKLSYILAPLILIGFVLVTNYGQLQKKDPGLFGAAIFDGSSFALFYLLAMIYRKKTHYHARFMILTALPFINPALGRLISPMVSVPVQLLLLLTLMTIDIIKKRPYRPYVIGLVALLFLLGVIVYISVIDVAIIEGMWAAVWANR